MTDIYEVDRKRKKKRTKEEKNKTEEEEKDKKEEKEEDKRRKGQKSRKRRDRAYFQRMFLCTHLSKSLYLWRK